MHIQQHCLLSIRHNLKGSASTCIYTQECDLCCANTCAWNRAHCSAWLSMTILRNSSPSMFSFSMRMAAALCRTSMLL